MRVRNQWIMCYALALLGALVAVWLRWALEPLVGDLQFGFALTWSDVRLGYTHVLRTREFKTQGKTGEFGAVSLSIQF